MNEPRDRTGELERAVELIFRSALRAVHGEHVVRQALGRRGELITIAGEEIVIAAGGRLMLLGIGKAAAPMAAAAEAVLGERLDRGCVITKYGHAMPLARCQVFEAAHPVPDTAGVAATQQVLGEIDALGKDDVLLTLISGGASALFVAPAPGVALEDLQQLTHRLLAAGASIDEINSVRKHCSQCSGGRLAYRAAPARVRALIISDVVGDDLSAIASGPTTADPTTYRQAVEVLERYGLRGKVPARVLEYLESGVAGEVPETPKYGGADFANVRNVIIANNASALDAAADSAASLGFAVHRLARPLSGEARQAGQSLAELAAEVRRRGRPVSEPACLLAGGETTVRVHGAGRGGRNQECALAAVQSLAGLENAVLLCAGTDGQDGSTTAAGAMVSGLTWERAGMLGLPPGEFLDRNDSCTFFERAGGHLITGPTRTNVMDIAILLLDRHGAARYEALDRTVEG